MKILIVILLGAFIIGEVASVPVQETSHTSTFAEDMGNDMKIAMKSMFETIKDGMKNVFKEAAKSILHTTNDFLKDLQDNLKHRAERVVASFNVCVESLRQRFGIFKNDGAKSKAEEIETKLENAVLATKEDFDKFELDVKESAAKLRTHSQHTIDATLELLHNQLETLGDKYEDETPHGIHCRDTHSPELNEILINFTESLQQCSMDTENASQTLSQEVSGLSSRLSTILTEILNSVQPCTNSRSSNVRKTEECLDNAFESSNSLMNTACEDMKDIDAKVENIRKTAEADIAQCSQRVQEISTNHISEIDNKMHSCISQPMSKDSENQVE